MTGQAVAGLLVSLINVITTEADTATDDCGSGADDCEYHQISYSALSYFLLATGVLGMACVAFFRLLLLPITKYYTAHPFTSDPEPGTSNIKEGLVETENPMLDAAGKGDVNAVAKRKSAAADGGDITDILPNVSSTEIGSEWSFPAIKKVLQQVWIPAVSVWGVFVVSLSTFPAITVNMVSTQKCDSSERFYNDQFVPFLYVMFNLGDFSGRWIAQTFPPLFNAQNLWKASLGRVILVPIYLLCNIDGNQLVNVFTGDAWAILLTLFLGLSNGYVCSLAMLFGPGLVNVKQASLAGTIMIFSLTFGLLCGALLSLVTVTISQGHL
jgi:equilibrative nucleoside transporter 1/2/3